MPAHALPSAPVIERSRGGSCTPSDTRRCCRRAPLKPSHPRHLFLIVTWLPRHASLSVSRESFAAPDGRQRVNSNVSICFGPTAAGHDCRLTDNIINKHQRAPLLLLRPLTNQVAARCRFSMAKGFAYRQPPLHVPLTSSATCQAASVFMAARGFLRVTEPVRSASLARTTTGLPVVDADVPQPTAGLRTSPPRVGVSPLSCSQVTGDSP